MKEVLLNTTAALTEANLGIRVLGWPSCPPFVVYSPSTPVTRVIHRDQESALESQYFRTWLVGLVDGTRNPA